MKVLVPAVAGGLLVAAGLALLVPALGVVALGVELFGFAWLMQEVDDGDTP